MMCYRDAANDLDDELLDTSLSPDEIRDLETKRARDMRERALRAEVLYYLVCSHPCISSYSFNYLNLLKYTYVYENQDPYQFHSCTSQ